MSNVISIAPLPMFLPSPALYLASLSHPPFVVTPLLAHVAFFWPLQLAPELLHHSLPVPIPSIPSGELF